MTKICLPSLSEAFPKELGSALADMGDYVYAYYRPQEYRPFYVGKGKKSRVLTHWKQAVKVPNRPHEIEIQSILRKGKLPAIKLLAYHLECTKGIDVASTVERVLQDAFGIQKVWEKRGGVERLVQHEAELLQSREDSAKLPALSLEAVVAKSGLRKCEVTLSEIADMVGAPVMMVGLSRTYHPSYDSNQVSEMARMYWALDKFKNTALPRFRAARSPVLLAWSSQLNKNPMIVGAWRVRAKSPRRNAETGRCSVEVDEREDFALRRLCLGLRLTGTGNNWQGPRFAIPSEEQCV